MDVDRAADPRRERCGVEDAHEPREHDEIGRMRGDAREEIGVEPRAIGVAARIERERLDAGALGAAQRLAIGAIARDQRDLERRAATRGFDQGFEIRATAGSENRDAKPRAHAMCTRSPPRADTTSPIVVASSPSLRSAAIVVSRASAATIST